MFLSNIKIERREDMESRLDSLMCRPFLCTLKSMDVEFAIFSMLMKESGQYGICRVATEVERSLLGVDVLIILNDEAIAALSVDELDYLLAHFASGVLATYKGAGTPVIYTNKGYLQISPDAVMEFGTDMPLMGDLRELLDLEGSDVKERSGMASWANQERKNAINNRRKNSRF